MRISIRSALIGGFVALQVIPVTVILALSYLSSEKVLLSYARDIMGNIAALTLREARGYLDPARDAARLTQRLADSDVVSRRNQAALEQYFYEQLGLHSNFAGIYLGTPDGGFVYVSRTDTHVAGGYRTKRITYDAGRRTTELVWKNADQIEIGRELAPDDTYDPRVRPWYTKALSAGDTVWTDPYIFFTSKNPGLTAASPAYDESGILVGVVGVDIEIDQISTFLSTLKVGKHGRAFILTQSGDVVAFPDPEKIKHPAEKGGGALRLTRISELDDPLSRRAFDSLGIPIDRFDVEAPVFGSFVYDGRTYDTMFAPFTEVTWPWVIGIYMPEDDYVGPLKRNRTFTIALMLGVAGAATLAGLRIARSVVKPMVALQAEALAVRDGDLDLTRDKSSGIKEIQQTADTFTRMKEGLAASRARNEELTRGLEDHARELELKELRLRATFTSLVNFSDALLILDQDHEVRFVNPAAETLLGAPRASFLDRPFPYALVTEGQVGEIPVDRAGGTRAVADMRVVSTEWEGRPALLVALRDVTDRRAMEAEIRLRADTLAALHETALELAAQRDLPDLLRAIAVRATTLLGATGAGVFLVRDGALEAALDHDLGTLPAGTRFGPGVDVPGRVWQTRRSLIIDEYPAWEARSGRLAAVDLRACVAAPFLWGGECLGVILVGDARPGRFTAADVALLERFSPLAAAALEQRRLLEEAEVLSEGAHRDAQTKSVLLKEVNHRVKNNLTSIIGLLYAERRHAGEEGLDPAYERTLEGLIGRVQGLAAVHQLLTSTEWAPVRVSDLVGKVLASAVDGLDPGCRVSAVVSPSEVRVEAARASTLAMVVNEVATNAVKHAARARQTCHVDVSVGGTEGGVEMVFRDDGPGYPPEILRGEGRNTGMYLIRSLVTGDLRGEVFFANDGGAVTTIRFAGGDLGKGRQYG